MPKNFRLAAGQTRKFVQQITQERKQLSNSWFVTGCIVLFLPQFTRDRPFARRFVLVSHAQHSRESNSQKKRIIHALHAKIGCGYEGKETQTRQRDFGETVDR